MQSMGIPHQKELLLMSKGWKNGSTSRWRKLRAAVIARDGGCCQYCGSEENLHVDHIIGNGVSKTINRVGTSSL